MSKLFRINENKYRITTKEKTINVSFNKLLVVLLIYYIIIYYKYIILCIM